MSPDERVGAAVAGLLLLAIPAIDSFVTSAPGALHALVGFFGIGLLAISTASAR